MNIKYLVLVCACALSFNLLSYEEHQWKSVLEKRNSANEALGKAIATGDLPAFKKLFLTDQATVLDRYKNQPILNYAIDSYISGLAIHPKSFDAFRDAHKSTKLMIDFLLTQKAPLWLADEEGNTPLHRASHTREDILKSIGRVEQLEDLIILLLKKGADINSQNKNGDTPLHLAVKMQSPKIIKLLLNKGAEAGIKNNQGLTAPALAIKENKDPIYSGRESAEIVAIFNKHFKPMSFSKVRATEKKNPLESTKNVGFRFE